MKELFTYMGKDWIRVKWLTLTLDNGTDMGKAYEHYDQFLWEMTKHHKCHFHWRWGADWGVNKHGHMIVSVPVDEHQRFLEKDKTFKAWKHWRFKNLWYKDWENGHKTEGYACKSNKHTEMDYMTRCPKRSAPCRADRCSHNIAS